MKKILCAALTLIILSLSGRAQTEYTSYKDFERADWWKVFGDELLDSLITVGVENNYNAAIALKRIEVAKSGLMSARAGYYPTAGLSIGWTADRLSGYTSSTATPATRSTYLSGQITMSWELDVFGRITAKVRESKAQVRVSRAEYEATMLSLQAQIATAYFSLRAYQEELEITRRHAESQLKVVKITEARHETGLASNLDVAQAKMVYYSTVASVPQLENSVRTSINSIAVLLGVIPGDISGTLTQARSLPDCRGLVPFEIPMEALENRPDIIEAKEQIEAAAASLGVAKKEYLPSLALTGSIGTEAHRAGDLFKKDSFTYTFAPTLSWTIFDGLARKADVISARENMEIQIETYNQTLLTALEEADNSMSAYFSTLRYMDNIGAVIDYSRTADELSIDLYKQGLGTFTNVMDAQISLLSYENEYVEAHNNALAALVSLYKAIGGNY